MSEWCLAHPWLTFFLALAAINTLRCLIGVKITVRQAKD